MKRGASGLSLVVAVNKPTGMSSHDVVNRCRRIFGERRVGHTGTLDPLAAGVLPICIGPATRLDKYMVGHDKRYRVTMRFGFETTTDDMQGDVTVTGDVLDDLLDGEFADAYVAGLVGEHDQIPPQYSAIKVGGKKAYEVARKGDSLKLEARRIEVFESTLINRSYEDGALYWTVDFSVSKGTYIRALVRDMGRELGCPAHVVALERRTAGSLTLDDCVSLESLEALGVNAAIDPVRILGYRIAFAEQARMKVESGAKLSQENVRIFEINPASHSLQDCCCTPTIFESETPLRENELVSVVIDNHLKAIYRFESGCLKPDCVFSTPISRGL